MGTLHPIAPKLNGGNYRSMNNGGDNSGGGGMEARFAKLEAATQHIETDIKDIKTDIRDLRKDAKDDFRILFGALIFSNLGLAALLAKGFKWF